MNLWCHYVPPFFCLLTNLLSIHCLLLPSRLAVRHPIIPPSLHSSIIPPSCLTVYHSIFPPSLQSTIIHPCIPLCLHSPITAPQCLAGFHYIIPPSLQSSSMHFPFYAFLHHYSVHFSVSAFLHYARQCATPSFLRLCNPPSFLHDSHFAFPTQSGELFQLFRSLQETERHCMKNVSCSTAPMAFKGKVMSYSR